METSPLYHYPLRSTIYATSTCDEDAPCSSSSSSGELTSQFTQGSEVIHNEKENNQIIEYHLHSLLSLVFHGKLFK